MKRLSFCAGLLLTVGPPFLVLLVAGNVYGAGRVIRVEGTPVRFNDITEVDGSVCAGLYGLPGHTVAFSDNGSRVIYGACYIEAVKGGHWKAMSKVVGGPASGYVLDGEVCSLTMERVEWDDEGRTTSISGLRPVLSTFTGKKYEKKEIKITSDTVHPKIANGNLYIKLDGHGDAELWVKMLFGDIVGIGWHKKIDPPSTKPSDNAWKDMGARGAEYPPVIGDLANGFYLVAELNAEKYSERGELSGRVRQLWLIPVKDRKAGEKRDLEWVSDKFSGGVVGSKLFGTLKLDCQWSVEAFPGDKQYWILLPTVDQAKKIQQSLADPATVKRRP